MLVQNGCFHFGNITFRTRFKFTATYIYILCIQGDLDAHSRRTPQLCTGDDHIVDPRRWHANAMDSSMQTVSSLVNQIPPVCRLLINVTSYMDGKSPAHNLCESSSTKVHVRTAVRPCVMSQINGQQKGGAWFTIL